MNRIKVFILILAAVAVFPRPAHASNLAISSITLVNLSSWTVDVQFDISWDNSWYTQDAPSATANWDAAWVFIKFSTRATGGYTWGPWNHALLLGTGDTLASGAQEKYSGTSSTYTGVFLYRNAPGSGTNNWTGTALRWNFGANEVSSTTVMAVQVFGVEMVYVSSGPFYLGDGATPDPYNNQFYRYPTTSNKYQVSSEGAITVGTTSGNLYYPTNGYGGDYGTPIPTNFPKGFNAFYVMKSEISQRQYCDFLNTLTPTQSTTRAASISSNHVIYGFGTYRNWIIKASNGKYGVDGNLNANDTWGSADYFKLNESGDGGWTAASYLTWADGAAYADWAALRPYTELEFEKAARGPLAAVVNEYAWGSTSLTTATGISSSKTSSEVPSNSGANCVADNTGPNGPLRSGSMARSTTTRVQSGAGYYGALDLSGNLNERMVHIGDPTGRGFTGVPGDGALDAIGNANVTNWPGADGTGSGFRGGCWADGASYCGGSYLHISDRYLAVYTVESLSPYGNGFRAARTAP